MASFLYHGNPCRDRRWIEGDTDGAVPDIWRRNDPGGGQPGARIRDCRRLCYHGRVTILAQLALFLSTFGDSQPFRTYLCCNWLIIALSFGHHIYTVACMVITIKNIVRGFISEIARKLDV